MRILITVNGKAGSFQGSEFTAENIQAEFAKYGISPEIYDVEEHLPEDIQNYVENGNYDVVAASGGDGTVNLTAQLLQGSKIAFGVIPSGTLNHFARDLNIPLNLADSVKLIVQGKSFLVDTACVNGKLFLNNSSIGFYPLSVRKRETQQSRLGRNKWLSMFYGIYSVLRKFPLYAVRISANNETLIFRTPVVFIGNNEYSTELLTIGSRKTLTGGKLCLYMSRSNTRLKMLKMVIYTFLNRLKDSGELEMRMADEIIIESRKKNLSVSIDGEVKEMVPPLHYEIKPRSLKVIFPGNGS